MTEQCGPKGSQGPDQKVLRFDLHDSNAKFFKRFRLVNDMVKCASRKGKAGHNVRNG